MVDITKVLALGALLFGIGLIGVIVRRNFLVVLMAIELMLNGVNITLVGYSRAHANLDGQVLAFFLIAVAAAEAAIGLALVVALFHGRRSVYVDDATLMRH